MSASKGLLSVKELAEELGVSVDTIRRAYWKGAIPGFKICKVLRFRLEIVELGGLLGWRKFVSE